MEFVLSKHATERIKARNITEETITFVLKEADSVIAETKCKNIYQKVIKENGSKYLYRVFVNICRTPTLVITAYKTSKLAKYEY